MMLKDKNILLVISGGIAAYKSLELIRALRKENATVRCILTKGGEQFVTPMSVSALSEHEVYTDLWSLKDESEMGHIQLSREADLIIVAPASANTIAKMANGLADDLASTCLLAANKPVMIVPAMNQMMWDNPATQENIKTLASRGIQQIGPEAGEMACGETGLGRMSEPETIMEAIKNFFFDLPLKGIHATITSGPTYEAIDPVRFIGNRSSGKQGHAIAQALITAGAEVTYITGPTNLKAPKGSTLIPVESAQEMLSAVEDAIPSDIFIGTAAVCDWKIDGCAEQKIKKNEKGTTPSLSFVENPDILKTVGHHAQRPQLVIGFAAETESLEENAKAKLTRKNCDWLVGNDVSASQNIFGSDENEVCLLKRTDDSHSIDEQRWPRMSKADVASKLIDDIIVHFKNIKDDAHDNNTAQAAE